MTRPRVLDLFSGAGGAGEGYRRAGYDVTGVDIEPHEYPCGDFITADAMDVLTDRAFLDTFDLVHASPPCQRFSTATPAHRRDQWPDLIGPCRDLLTAWGGVYVIENVAGARRALRDPFRLCGSSFGLRVRRHRWFEANAFLVTLPCRHAEQGIPLGIYGDHGDASGAVPRPGGTSRGVKARDLEEARTALGIPWMAWHDLAESIPPAYTEWIGAQLITQTAPTGARA